MATDTKASALRAVRHYWTHLNDEEIKPLVVQLASREGNTVQEIADAAATSREAINQMIVELSQAAQQHRRT